MSRRNLEFLLRPRSVAVVGASDRPHSVGATVIRNLLGGAFEGPVWPVNARHPEVAGRPAFRSVADLPDAPDLAVICTPAPGVPGLVAELGERGTRAAVVLSAGLEQPGRTPGRTISDEMLAAARPHLLRVLGPNCVGLLVPRLGLNASFAHATATPGHLAFVAQSGALVTAMLDWARARSIGFSHFISLGNSADVDFGDLLDYLASDPHTRAILLYVESIGSARKFMSAARAAARNKPVIVVKSGRAPEGAKAASSHTGALAGSDDVYDAAFRRAGMLRVGTTLELFDAAETLARITGVGGRRLAIVSNGGGPGVMATDALVAGGGKLAELSPHTVAALDQALPANWSHGNPVDLIGDAPPDRYVAAIEALLAESAADAVLFIQCPTAIVPSTDIAKAVAPLLRDPPRPVLACWMGRQAVREAEEIFAQAGIPTYATPEEAVGAFLHLADYERNQRQLMESPPSIPDQFRPSLAGARAPIEAALAAGRDLLTEPEAKAVLAAYGVPVVETRIARGVEDVVPLANEIGFPVALKILSPDITHKSDVRGVALNIATEAELLAAARAMLARCAAAAPGARLEGFTVQQMARRPGAFELIAGIATDPTFGPVVLFGQGGTAVEAIGDKAVGLPPLNLALASDLIGRTRVARLLGGYRSRPPVDLRALELVLVQLSQLVADVPEIVELDINPLLADERGVLALDARIRVQRTAASGPSRLAIRPYPRELEETVELNGHPLLLRPIRPEDRAAHEAFVARIEPEDMRTRFFRVVRSLPSSELARLTQIDYEREMAFIAVDTRPDGQRETLGVARAYTDPENHTAEFAILVRSDLKGQGLGYTLLAKLVRYCRERGTRFLVGEVLSDNTRMLHLAEELGFRVEPPRDGCVHVRLALDA